MRGLLLAAAAVMAAAGVVAAAAPWAARAVALGAAAPLAVAVGSALLMQRAYRRSPERLTQLLVRAFVAKLVLFGLYMTATITMLELDALWFAGSFTVAFVTLHLAEALHLQRLYVA